jgi:hypothetical protein
MEPPLPISLSLWGMKEEEGGVVYLKDNTAIFEVVKFSDITDKIIPFFDKYSIQGKKSWDFLSLKEAAVIIKSKDHLTPDGLDKILDLKARMNQY